MELRDKVALVTGASRGIGESICLKLLEKGVKVYGTSRSENRMHPYELLKMDVTRDEDCAAAVAKVLEREGRIDLFISNAGAGVGGPVESSDIDEARWQFDVNYFGMLRMLSHVLPVMRNQRGGRIVLVSSVAGFIPVPYQALYTSTKYAIEAIGLCLRSELKPFGIEVMLANPGDTKTGFTENRIYAKGLDESSVYYKRFMKSMKKMEHAEKTGMNPAVVSSGIVSKLEKKKLSVRYIPGWYKAVYVVSRIMPGRMMQFFIEKLYL